MLSIPLGNKWMIYNRVQYKTILEKVNFNVSFKNDGLIAETDTRILLLVYWTRLYDIKDDLPF